MHFKSLNRHPLLVATTVNGTDLEHSVYWVGLL